MSDFYKVVLQFVTVGAIGGALLGATCGWPKTGALVGAALAVAVFFWILSKADFG